jgi:O-antigen ligase
VDNVSLRDAHGQELLANGDFEQGGDFWFFVSDDHLLWHVKNLFLHVLVEMGLLGLLAVLAMLCQAFAAVKRTWKQDGVVGSSFCASLLAFLTVGIVVSPFEAPRLTALFLLLCFFIIFRDEQKPVPPQT